MCGAECRARDCWRNVDQPNRGEAVAPVFDIRPRAISIGVGSQPPSVQLEHRVPSGRSLGAVVCYIDRRIEDKEWELLRLRELGQLGEGYFSDDAEAASGELFPEGNWSPRVQNLVVARATLELLKGSLQRITIVEPTGRALVYAVFITPHPGHRAYEVPAHYVVEDRGTCHYVIADGVVSPELPCTFREMPLEAPLGIKQLHAIRLALPLLDLMPVVLLQQIPGHGIRASGYRGHHIDAVQQPELVQGPKDTNVDGSRTYPASGHGETKPRPAIPAAGEPPFLAVIGHDALIDMHM